MLAFLLEFNQMASQLLFVWHIILCAAARARSLEGTVSMAVSEITHIPLNRTFKGTTIVCVQTHSDIFECTN